MALVTHATKNLALCDRVVVMGRGGHLVFDGTPADALGFFGVDGYDGIYTALDEAPAGALARAGGRRQGGGGPDRRSRTWSWVGAARSPRRRSW